MSLSSQVLDSASPKNTLLRKHSTFIFRKFNIDTVLNVLIALTKIWPVIPIMPFITFTFLIQDPIQDLSALSYHIFFFSFHIERFLRLCLS